MFAVCFSLFAVPVVASSTVIEPSSVSDGKKALISWTKFTVQYKGRVILNLSSPGSILRGRILGILGPSG